MPEKDRGGYLALCSEIHNLVNRECTKYESKAFPIHDAESLLFVIEIHRMLKASGETLARLREGLGIEGQAARKPMQLLEKTVLDILTPLLSLEPKYDSLNPFNAARWYNICIESLKTGKHGRLWEALDRLAEIPMHKLDNAQEAFDYLALLYWLPGEHPASEMLQERALEQLLSYVAENNWDSARPVAKALVARDADGQGWFKDIVAMSHTLLAMLRNYDQLPEAQKARYFLVCEEAYTYITNQLEDCRSAGALPVDDFNAMIELGKLQGMFEQIVNTIIRIKEAEFLKEDALNARFIWMDG
ncbi:hypothetical protein DRN67_03270 [Candidatus Micrarchaeota archaeon]|nr:MAG: hypothetical protein DRN67_03270 [Candidatus Micrarchaeota archaeon]